MKQIDQKEDTSSLRITEIFLSIQGESIYVGLPTVFVRLTGCPLRCHYCDTTYAFHGGQRMQLSEIIETVTSYEVPYVLITGGEPLAQPPVLSLMKQLCDKGYRVSIETSGALDISKIDPRVMCVMDIKTPASGEVDKNRYANITHLSKKDQVKFVLCNRQAYDWAKQIIKQYDLTAVTEVLFSPTHQVLAAQELARWIIEDRLPVRLQIQLHKYLGVQ